MRRILLLLTTVAAVLLMMVFAGVAGAQGGGAMAPLEDAEGNDVGAVQLTEDQDGVVGIAVQAQGLEPGTHGIHFHETGECSPPDFESAGEHFNPTSAQHGLENPEGPHAGDLPNLTVDEDGTADYEATADLVTLSEGETSLFDSDGSALVIHAGEDDQMTDPAGDSGDRVVCGVVQASTTAGGAQGWPSVLPLVILAGLAVVVGAGIFLWRRTIRS